MLERLRLILKDPIASLLLCGLVLSVGGSFLQPYARYLIPIFLGITLFYLYLRWPEIQSERDKEKLIGRSFENILTHVLVDILNREGDAKVILRMKRRNISNEIQFKAKHEITQERDIPLKKLNIEVYWGDGKPLPPIELLQKLPQKKEFNVVFDREIEPLSHPFEYYYTFDWPKAFSKKKEWFELLVNNPTKELIVEIILPKGYPLKEANSFEKPQTGIIGEIGQPIFNVKSTPDKRIFLRLQKKRPKIDCFYRIGWLRK